MIGSTLGKYRIVEQLGRGGMGTVYKAVDETLDREVAIKLLNADLLTPERLQRFRGEAVSLAKLSHPHIAAIHELAREGHDLLMVMEYISGETCEKMLARTGPLPVSRAIAICDQLLDALEHAHAAGIVHRDLKPSNVMITATGDIKVMDFGIARVAGTEHLTTNGYLMGTPAYMAPEQVRGEEVDRRMDLYAAAVMLYRMVTHHLPFDGDTAFALIHAQLHTPPAPPRRFRPDLPDWIDALLARGLAKTPADRFQTAAEFRLALERGLAGNLADDSLRPRLGNGSAETIGPVLTPAAFRIPVPSLSVSAPRPIPEPAAAAHTDTTVMLRTPHLAAAGALLALLVVGVGVLAYAALRRPPATIITPAALPPPVITASAPKPVSEPTPPPVSSSGAAPSDVSATPLSLMSSAKAEAAPTARQGGPPPSTTVKPAAKKTLPGRDPADHSATVANLPAESFGDVRALLVDGTKTREWDALLNLEPDKLIVRNRDDGAVLQAVAYQSIGAATYIHAKRPRGTDDASVVPIPKSLGGSGFFLKTSKHWLTLQSKTDLLVLRLEDKNVMRVLASLESRTGTKVARPIDRDK